jgi:molybdopterin converting factor small subunit
MARVKITVKLGAPLSQVIGEARVILSLSGDVTLARVLDELRARHPDFEAGLRGKGLRMPQDRVLYTLFVNARPVAFQDAGAMRLQDGDRVYIFLPVAGG